MLTTVLIAVSLAGAGQVVPLPPPPRPVPVDPGQMVRDPGRRPPPEPKGTATIRGRVVAGDTGTPIRRAMVNLSVVQPPQTTTSTGVPPAAFTTTVQTMTVNGGMTTVTTPGAFARPKSATTDAQGVFEFRELPAGTYRLSASPGQYSAAYLSMNFGAKKPNGPGSIDPGTPIDLGDGQVFDKATIGLVRGAVITGRVTDENGEALARAQVYTVLFPAGSSRGMRTGGNAQTDDLGQFRLFGLLPGEYAVAAEARGNTFVGPNAPPETEEDKIGFLTTYYPGTPDDASAQRVRTRTGAETPGVEIRMVSGRLFHLNGVVVDSQGRTGPRGNGTLYKRTTGTTVTSTFGFSTDEQGRFQMRNIPPGSYRLTVRQQPAPTGARNADGSFAEQGEFASMPISLMSDLDNVLVTTSPGATITGVVVFESGPPQLAAGQTTLGMRVSATIGDPENMIGAPTPQPALVSADMTFTMKGLSGEMLLRSSGPGNVLKSVQLGTTDITDTPHEFKTGERVTLVLTSRASTLEGNATDAVGKPTSDALLMLFSDDKSQWRNNSIRTRRSSADPVGHFKFSGLLAGRYYLVAVPRDRVSALSDSSAFEALSKEATTVVVGEDEQRQVDVKVSAGGGH